MLSLKLNFRFMTGCAIEFLGVYLITSKRDKQAPALSIRADSTSSVEFTTTAMNNTPVDEAVYVSETDVTPAIPSRPSDSQTLNINSRIQPVPASTTNNSSTTATADPSSPRAHFAPDPAFPRRSLATRTDGTFNPNRTSATFRSSNTHANPSSVTHDDWHGNTNSNAASAKQAARRKRRSSVFRGISLTSQLVDRINEDPPHHQQQPIQLPPSSPTWQQAFGLHSHHRRGDSLTAFGNIISGLTGTSGNHDNNNPATGTSGTVSPPNNPSSSTSLLHHHQPDTFVLPIESDADAVEIDIPTASTLSSQRNSEDDRELVPLGSKRNSARLVNIEENTEYRDLS